MVLAFSHEYTSFAHELCTRALHTSYAQGFVHELLHRSLLHGLLHTRFDHELLHTSFAHDLCIRALQIIYVHGLLHTSSVHVLCTRALHTGFCTRAFTHDLLHTGFAYELFKQALQTGFCTQALALTSSVSTALSHVPIGFLALLGHFGAATPVGGLFV